MRTSTATAVAQEFPYDVAELLRAPSASFTRLCSNQAMIKSGSASAPGQTARARRSRARCSTSSWAAFTAWDISVRNLGLGEAANGVRGRRAVLHAPHSPGPGAAKIWAARSAITLDRLVCLLDGARPHRVHRCPQLVDLGAAKRRPDSVLHLRKPVELLIGKRREAVELEPGYMSPARAQERRQSLLADPAPGRVPQPPENGSGMLPVTKIRVCLAPAHYSQMLRKISLF